MKIVIDVPEEAYKEIHSLKYLIHGLKSEENRQLFYQLINAIQDGTPLPKHHGRLIDADALWKKWVFDAIGKQEIDEAPTIIEGNDSGE